MGVGLRDITSAEQNHDFIRHCMSEKLAPCRRVRRFAGREITTTWLNAAWNWLQPSLSHDSLFCRIGRRSLTRHGENNKTSQNRKLLKMQILKNGETIRKRHLPSFADLNPVTEQPEPWTSLETSGFWPSLLPLSVHFSTRNNRSFFHSTHEWVARLSTKVRNLCDYD